MVSDDSLSVKERERDGLMEEKREREREREKRGAKRL